MLMLEIYKRLCLHYGPQHWWPVTEKGKILPTYKARKRFSERQKLEVCIGAILAQNTDWKNVMKALENLNRANLIDCKKIIKLKPKKLAELIRPSGYYNQKAKRLKLFCKYLQKNYNGKLEKLFSKPLNELRAELLSLQGIGNETADDILLYAARRPSFVVDAYTLRFLERFFGKKKMAYVEAKGFFESALPKDVAVFSEFHALLVEHGKQYCRKKPLCGDCFLKKECGFGPGRQFA